jgi:hypothetical protein
MTPDAWSVVSSLGTFGQAVGACVVLRQGILFLRSMLEAERRMKTPDAGSLRFWWRWLSSPRVPWRSCFGPALRNDWVLGGGTAILFSWVMALTHADGFSLMSLSFPAYLVLLCAFRSTVGTLSRFSLRIQARALCVGLLAFLRGITRRNATVTERPDLGAYLKRFLGEIGLSPPGALASIARAVSRRGPPRPLRGTLGVSARDLRSLSCWGGSM